MKFYAERLSQIPGETSEEDNLVVRIVNAVFNYDWEYLGASDRLVVPAVRSYPSSQSNAPSPARSPGAPPT